VRARIERRAQDVGFRTFGLMRFSTVSFGNTSLAIAAQSAHQAALAELEDAMGRAAGTWQLRRCM
jgi:hypothetical protein